VERDIHFSTSLSFEAPEAVYLFVQDLQDVDDLFEIPWFWAKDSEGLERLSPAEMLAFGLGEPRQSKIFFSSRDTALEKDPRVFHEFFGFAPDSPEIPRFLDLPVASLEWDGAHRFSFYSIFLIQFGNPNHRLHVTGDDNGPLTPWESLVWIPSDYVKELNRFLDA